MLAMHDDWRSLLQTEMEQPYFRDLLERMTEQEAAHRVYPKREQWLRALELTPYHAVKVVILGQDPYHHPGQAHGLSFSVPEGVALPPSLRNMYAELQTDLACEAPASGDLSEWARQGVLLLNTVMTVREYEPLSHRGLGWEPFTDAIIRLLNERQEPLVFVLWGGPARQKGTLINRERHAVIESAHPSPLSAYRGFFGSRPYSRANEYLRAFGVEPIRWV